MIRLVHLSDVHLGPLPSFRAGELMNKRLTGWLNWQLARARHLRQDILTGLVAHMASMSPHLIAVSGDLVNLALPAEFEQTARWLETLGPASRVAVIPGNHDVYVAGALEKAESAWGNYMRGETLDAAPFPFVRRIGEVALVGCNSAVPRPPFVASGQFTPDQALRLETWLRRLGEMGFFRVVMIHHPVTGNDAADWRRGLAGADLFRKAIAAAGAELVLHGHLHRSTDASLAGPKGEIPVLGIASASGDPASGEKPARYNLFEIERAGAGFSCILTEYGYQRIGDDIVQRLKVRLS